MRPKQLEVHRRCDISNEEPNGDYNLSERTNTEWCFRMIHANYILPRTK